MTDLIDTHSHLADPRLRDELEVVLQRARDAGVVRVIAIGAAGSIDTDRLTVELAESYAPVFAVVGVHPHDAKALDRARLDALEALIATSRKVVAVGETGLDFHYNYSSQEQQEKALVAQLELAARCDLPVVIHCRLAEKRLVEILKQVGVPPRGGVIHSFTGDRTAAEEFLSLGLYLSFSGILTFKNAEQLREVARLVPAERILVETDAPYLAPHPMRGRRNEPAFVRYTLERLAEVRNQTPQDLAGQIMANAAQVFGIQVLSSRSEKAASATEFKNS